MIDKVMLNRVLDIMNSSLYSGNELQSVLEEFSEKSSLMRTAVYLVDFEEGVCSKFYEWVHLRGEVESKSERISLDEREKGYIKSCFTLGRLFVLDDYVDDRIASLFSRITGSYVEGTILVPMCSDGEVIGFVLYDALDNADICAEDEEDLKLIAGIMTSFLRSRKSDAESKMKSDFLSRMSHEIRTPMNAIIGMTGIAQKSLDDIARVEDCLGKIDTSTKYLLSLINNILDMSKIESGKMQIVNDSFSIDALVDSIRTLLKPQADLKNIKLWFIKEYSCPNVIGDELKIMQVLINLVGNALKFTPKGGKIIIRVEELLNEDDDVVLRFMVKDSGVGIEAKNLDKIFRAFEQAENNTSTVYGGTGLGLTISYELVKLMGGELQVSSTVGKGSDFYFTLYFKKVAEEELEIGKKQDVSEMREESYDFSGRRVLVVEDNELNSEIAVTVLEMVGFVTETAENGAVAVEMFKKSAERYYDVILMDVRMPVMDGLEATKRIRESGKAYAKRVPIIAMTANAFDDDMRKSISSGMDGHLSKPVDTKLLYKELKRVLK